MTPLPRSKPPRLALGLGAVAALAAGALVLAAEAPHVESPHGKFREPCSECHSANAWTPARVSRKFDHSKYGFALTGAHATAGCLDCHATLEFTQKRTRCVSCHEDPHRGELGTECARCHGARSFVDRGPMLRMHQLTRFPLTGSHASLDCESCHTPAEQGRMQFVGSEPNCRTCHLAQYQAVQVPNHVAGGFSTSCDECHATTTWGSAHFDHARTAFPLTGAHVGAACTSCHGDGVYKGKSTACASCHQAQYAAATPAHDATYFPAAQCASCHNTTAWAAGTFPHDAPYFPIYSGRHAGRWNSCTDCHPSAGNYPTFTCMSGGCHGQSGTDAGHARVSGYSYSATACYSCHPRGGT